jgi:putative PIN family toxin of toxin-antitoxin system
MIRQRLVIDTNALVSHLMVPGSIPDRTVRVAMEFRQVLVSEATMMELADVLWRPKFERYIPHGAREMLLAQLSVVAESVLILRPVFGCRDPRDDKFLELAVNGAADLILTGDPDLLALHPFRTIPIITPAEWLGSLEPEREK